MKLTNFIFTSIIVLNCFFGADAYGFSLNLFKSSYISTTRKYPVKVREYRSIERYEDENIKELDSSATEKDQLVNYDINNIYKELKDQEQNQVAPEVYIPPAYPYYDVKENVQMQYIHAGIPALEKRLEMIRKAKKRISLEYFIFEKSPSGKLLLKELAKKAKAGVDVRLLVDMSISIIEINEALAEHLRHTYGIKIKYYNRALGPMTAQYRTHRKLFVIDGVEAIVGGRNIGDDYFDIDEDYNFLDRDMVVWGSMAKTVQDSFDAFWNDTETVLTARDVYERNTKRLFRGSRREQQRYAMLRERQLSSMKKREREWFEDNSDIRGLSEKAAEYGRPLLESYPKYNCPKMSYISDAPGGKFYHRFFNNFKENFQYAGYFIEYKMRELAKGEVILSSPYFMLNKRWRSLVEDMLKDDSIQLKVFTNSLNSTDAVYVSANFYRIIDKLIDLGMDTYVFNARFPHITKVPYEEVEKNRWGVHAKTFILNETTMMSGTYNIDNRSDVLNAEVMLMCEGSKEIVDDLRLNINKRMKNAYHLKGKNKALNSSGEEADIYGDATPGQVKFMKAIKLPSLLFQPLM